LAAGWGRGLGATGAGAGAGGGGGAVEDGAGATGADGVGATGADGSTGCTGTSEDGAEGTDAAGDGVGALRRARVRWTGRARSDARTPRPAAAPSVTRSPRAGPGAARGDAGCGRAAPSVPRSASATKPKEIVKIAAAMAMARSSAALSGRAVLTTRGTSWASSDRATDSDRCASERDGRG